MNLVRTLQLMEIELECIRRNENNECDRDCANCDIVQETEDLIDAYSTVISLLAYQIEKEKLEGVKNEYIYDERLKKTSFDKISNGQFFVFQGELYLKTNIAPVTIFNAINISNISSKKFSPNEEIEPVEVDIHIIK